ncbi:MAG: DNA repair protein RecO [Candidatus Beckwithbacteria bacterium]|nr:DNA repair protein RecO [Patescibacteria group bacterium]
MNRSYKLEAIILKRINFSEADRLVTVLSKTRGKVVLVAKGVRKLTSRKKGHLELFTHAKLQVVKTKGLGIITEAETINNFPNLRKNLNRVRIAYLLAELIDKMTAEGQEQQEVFELLFDSLATLNSKSATKNFILNFEKQLLEFLGFGLPNPPITQQRLETHIFTIIDHPLNSKKIR